VPLSLLPKQVTGTVSYHFSLMLIPLLIVSLFVQFHFWKIKYNTTFCQLSQVKHNTFSLKLSAQITCYSF
jgi:hypothetical protein